MPIIKSAKKKMRQDKKRTARNLVRKNNLKSLIKKARIEANPINLQAVFSALDKAVKVNLIHKNRSSRLKSRLSKGAANATPTKPVSKSAKKKPVKKTVVKKTKKA